MTFLAGILALALATSDPPPGSVMPTPQIDSPATHPGRYLARSSADPSRM
jgi:hypothetical protein